jgi:hypothetical protein
MTRIAVISLFALLSLAIPIVAQVPPEKVDLDAIFKIKDEGLNRSQVMDTLSYLTDVYGPRLTGSPQIKAAGDWAKKKLSEWELVMDIQNKFFDDDTNSFNVVAEISGTDKADELVMTGAIRGVYLQGNEAVASFAYHAANRDEKLPRKPLPPRQRAN